MIITFENVLERDIDMLIMRRFEKNDIPFIKIFASKVGIDWNKYKVVSIEHSVMTSDGESDVVIIASYDQKKIAFLIEDKIDAVAQIDQSKRYEIRANKCVENGEFDEYFIFIVAPQKYLDGNQEAAKYPNKVSYEEIREVLDDGFEAALVDKALDESKHGYVPIEDRYVTEFWNHLYDYVDNRFPDTFNINGKKGESRGTSAQWITINSGHGTSIKIKANSGYVDLELLGYADKFIEFSKANQDYLDKKRLCVRVASKSLAIRKYIEPIDFSQDFYEQEKNVEDAFYKALELQNIVKDLKF